MATSAQTKDLVTPEEAFALYGDPAKENNMIVFRPVQTVLLANSAIPGKIYCNADMVIPLTAAFACLLNKQLLSEIKTWDGCFNIRPQKGTLARQSLHSWGLAIDINAGWNQFGKRPTLSEEVVKCFTSNGFHWGGYWKRPDGMHFQLAKLPMKEGQAEPTPGKLISMDLPTLKPPYPYTASTELLRVLLHTYRMEQPIELVLQIRAFQKKYGLAVDGIVGPKTWAKLIAEF